jgi:hypothetical protein
MQDSKHEGNECVCASHLGCGLATVITQSILAALFQDVVLVLKLLNLINQLVTLGLQLLAVLFELGIVILLLLTVLSRGNAVTLADAFEADSVVLISTGFVGRGVGTTLLCFAFGRIIFLSVGR